MSGIINNYNLTFLACSIIDSVVIGVFTSTSLINSELTALVGVDGLKKKDAKIQIDK